jgi:hypothetical protein
MDLNTISQYVDLAGIKNLSNFFVVVKKYTNVTYYYGCMDPSRPSRYAHSSRYKNARYAIQFASLEEAQKKCDELNAQRKRIKFKVEQASKHFVSNFNLVYNNYSDKPVKLTNTPVSLQDYKEGKRQVNTRITPEMVADVSSNLKKLNNESEYFVKNIGAITQQKMRELELDYNRRVQELNARISQELNEKQKKLDIASNITRYLADGTVEELVTSNKSANDDKFEILYGKGNNGNA